MDTFPRIVVAGTRSGVGKTTIAVGIMAAWALGGRVVQAYKVGPDYLDPSLHTVATGRQSRNLDSWMAPKALLPELLRRASQGADVSVVEGVMGLFDGRDARSDEASTAEAARILDAPVVLVADARGTARSLAAEVLGYQAMASGVRLVGVVVNRVASPRHAELVRQAVQEVCGIPVLGALPVRDSVAWPSRHLGLVPAAERPQAFGWVRELAFYLSRHVDLDTLWQMAQMSPPLPRGTATPWDQPPSSPQAVIAVARDAAFNFYYPENLELLVHQGGELAFFSPLAGEPIPEEAGALYLGGGFPEEFLPGLSDPKYLGHLRARLSQGLPVLAECGGYMYLTESIESEGQRFAMAEVIPAQVHMTKSVVALGYREILPVAGGPWWQAVDRLRGHEFHYSRITYPGSHHPAYRVTRSDGLVTLDGWSTGQLVAGYSHLYFLSAPRVAKNMVALARRHRARKTAGP